jgi:hypothetical protein
MQGIRRQTATKAAAAKGADPRFAAIARLLARAAARRDFDKELKAGPGRAKFLDSAAEDKTP